MLLLSLFLKTVLALGLAAAAAGNLNLADLVRLSCSGQWSAAWLEIVAACAAAVGALYIGADAFTDGSRIVAALAVGGVGGAP